MHHVHWDALQAFLAVARTGRVSAAARRLEVEHTTVARRLAALEAELGVPLFYRSTTGYVLTPYGQNALASAEAMEGAALALTARAREGSGPAGRVRVAMAPEFASDWLAPGLPLLRERHPHIELHVLVGTRQRDLSRGEAELAIQSPRPRQQDLVSVRLARVSLGLYASRTLAPGSSWRITGLETLGDLPLLAYTAPFGMLQDAGWFQPVLAGASVAMRTNSTHALVAAARVGAGVAVLPRFVARRHADLMDVSDDVARHDLWLVAHPAVRRDPKIKAVGEFLKTLAAQPDGLC